MARLWRVDRFDVERDRWIAQEDPSIDLQFVVGEWILSRFDNPYRGVRREPDFDNLWFGPIPGTEQPGGGIVCCSYFVEERAGVLRCNSLGTLNRPV